MNHTAEEMMTVAAARELSGSRTPQDVAVAAEFILEGLYARKQVARSEERGYSAAEPDMTRNTRQRWN